MPYGVRITTEKLEAGETELSVEMEALVSEGWRAVQVPISLEVLSQDGARVYRTDIMRKVEGSKLLAKENICLKDVASWTLEHPYNFEANGVRQQYL